MSENNDPSNDLIAEVTAEIVSAYVGNNALPMTELSGLIASVAASFRQLGQPSAIPVAELLKPLVSIKKSVTSNYLISLEDGKRYRTLKRHLTKRGLTPEQYRAKWGLPADYPMVAPTYAMRRSEIAKTHGLGKNTPA